MVFLVAFATADLFTHRLPVTPERARDTQLDGLRGLLALAVFICHVAAWHHYLHTGSYMQAGAGLFSEFAKIGVFMFFMITGYLFIGKLLAEKEKGINWTKFAISRLLRIMPLYLFAMAVMLFIIILDSDFVINEALQDLFSNVLLWLTFTVYGQPIINDYADTLLVTSHVQWTLVYEWLFYLSLPLLAMALKIKVPLLYVLFTVLLVASIYWSADHLFLPSGFIGGGLTAVLCRYSRLKSISQHPVMTLFAIGLVIAQATFFPEFAYEQPTKIPALLLTFAFFIIAAGNNLFGILTCRAATYLGKISYSLYLMHGIVLFCTFKLVLGISLAASLPRPIFALVVFAVTIAVVMICSVTYHWVEEPAMKQVATATKQAQRLWLDLTKKSA